MKSNQTLTVGVPVFNESSNISKLLDSVINQDYQGITLEKVIVYDDASTDDTRLKLRKYAQDSTVIRVHEASRNLGKAAGINYICKHANTNILVLIDSDVVLNDTHSISKLTSKLHGNVALTNGWGENRKSNNAMYCVFEFSRKLIRQIGKYKPYYLSWGGFMALTQENYRSLILPVGTHRLDAYIYLQTISSGYDYALAESVSVLDRKDLSRLTFKQYAKLQHRATTYPAVFGEKFDAKLLEHERSLSSIMQLRSFIAVFMKHPYQGVVYCIYKISGKIYALITQYRASGQWRS